MTPMKISEFERQPRGPRLFDTWLWTDVVATALGQLPVELHTDMDLAPSEMAAIAAAEVAAFATAHDDYILDLIFGHYRRAEADDCLSFWDVAAGISREDILNFVESITLIVDSDLLQSIHINPDWDPEHKLSLALDGGAIVEVNDDPFELQDGILVQAF